MTDPSLVSPAATISSKSSFFQWFCIGLVLITALSILAVHLPERLKLLLVFAVVYGLIAGGLLTSLAVKLDVPVKRSLLVSILCLTVFGQSLVLYLSHQRYKEATLQQFKLDKTSLMLNRMMQGEPPTDPESRKQYDQVLKQFEAAKQERQDKEQQLLAVSSYLQHRISSVARVEAPWPQLFWTIELVFSCLAAIWASLQVSHPDSSIPHPEESTQEES
ncbi:hypothetical protein [Gimesia sp.]|uniref:hypothetical protein n=1 Tax=Gimesia sp. TaxID=2024833 RepID=UPI000C3E1F80|nr:hypothetical protein [Gimesia sp.]MAX35577.1 hypothetical protein [Gimesia sp.]HAH45768.1 hypothetical protein [Planctomycetaceae bacterium]HBL44224.1 hypothetical protein [Planctomycetaceae bacterium]|tara:strand:- start:211 stop:867 length:657 start_codon:yes stop_codon:yes gene_type:complete